MHEPPHDADQRPPRHADRDAFIEAAPNAEIRGAFQLELTDTSTAPLVRLGGAVDVELGSTTIDRAAELTGIDTGMRLVLDGSGFSSVVIDVSEHDDRWTLAIAPKGLDLSGDDLVYLATHDRLTGLANRELLRTDLAAALRRLERSEHELALLYIDLNGFKTINDTYGHRTGDQLLIEVAKRLVSASRPMDRVARLGGDEFVMLCEHVEDARAASAIAQRIIEVLNDPIDIEDRELSVAASVGIAMAQRGASAAELLQHADSAMFKAKTTPHAPVAVFGGGDCQEVAARCHMEDDLRSAVAQGELALRYRLIYSLPDIDLAGIEARVCWPRGGETLDADEFMPIAGAAGVAEEIGRWAIDNAVGALVKFRRHGLAVSIPMHIDLTAQQLLDARLRGFLDEALTGWNLAPSSLCIGIAGPILERGLSDQVLNGLSQLGIRFSVDGFGSGKSSLTSLGELPAHSLKLDQDLVSQVTTGSKARAVLSAITSLAKAYSIQTIAPGVSHPQDLEFLSYVGCDAAQGDALAAPMSEDEVVVMLRRDAHGVA